MSKPQSSKKPDFVVKAALLFGSGTLTSRILGLIRDALLFSLMPLDMKDAWLAAFRIPNFFRRLLGEGGLSVSFIPVYVGLQSENQRKERQVLINGVFSLLMSVVSLICLICFTFMDTIVAYWLSGPGFSQVPGKLEMTITMARVMVFFLFFVSLFAYFMALLNGLKKFTLTGFAPLFLNVSIISGLLWFHDTDQLALASAWAVVIGGAMQAFVLIPSVKASQVLPQLQWVWSHPQVKKVVRKFLPTVFAVGVLQVLALVNVYFASQLDSGAISYIYLADRLLELPLSLIAVSIGTTLLPTLSQYWKEQQVGIFKASVARHLSLFYFLALPAAFGLWFMGLDIIDVLFSRGEFTVQEVPIVAAILKIYCLTLLCAGSLKILNQAFYATGDTLTPAFISIAGLLIHLFMAPLLMARLQLNGLVLSTALVTLFNFCICSVLLQRKIGILNWKSIGYHFTKCLLASAAMGVYLFLLKDVSWKKGSLLLDFPLLLLLISGAGLIFFIAASLLQVEEMALFKKKLLKR